MQYISRWFRSQQNFLKLKLKKFYQLCQVCLLSPFRSKETHHAVPMQFHLLPFDGKKILYSQLSKESCPIGGANL